LFGEIVDTIDRAAFVAAGNDQGAGYGLDQERLPFTGNGGRVGQPLDERAFFDRADDDGVGA
jgi:hypothetical protein